jgi:hypothetical protein
VEGLGLRHYTTNRVWEDKYCFSIFWGSLIAGASCKLCVCNVCLCEKDCLGIIEY